MNPDFVALLRELSAAEARFLVVGGYAVSFHSRPRATGDLDLWVEPIAANAARVFRALRSFGAPLEGLAEADLTRANLVYQIGVPPCRVDLLTSLTGLDFEAAWTQRVMGRVGDLDARSSAGTRSCATSACSGARVISRTSSRWKAAAEPRGAPAPATTSLPARWGH